MKFGKKNLVVILSCFVCSWGLLACESAEDTTPEAPIVAEQVSFANWELRACTDGTMAVIGKDECQPIGSACPTGEWADLTDIEDRTILYVKPGVLGDVEPVGTKDNPYPSIKAAYDAAEPGTLLALSKGVFQEDLIFDKSISLRGACVTETILEPATPMEDSQPDSEANHDLATIEVHNGDGEWEFQDFQITGASEFNRMGIRLKTTIGRVEVKGVSIHQTMGMGISIEGHLFGMAPGPLDVVMDQVSITQTQPFPDSTLGYGISIARDGVNGGNTHVALNTVWLDHNYDQGMNVYNTYLNIDGLVISNTHMQMSNGLDGNGGNIWDSQVVGKRIWLENNYMAGFAFLDRMGNESLDSKTYLEDVVVKMTKANPNLRHYYDWADMDAGVGLLFWGGEMVLNRALVIESTTGGIAVVESPMPCQVHEGFMALCTGTKAEIENVTVVETKPDSVGRYGFGVIAIDGANLKASRLVASNNSTAGLVIQNGFRSLSNKLTSVQLEDIIVTGSKARLSDGLFGDGVVVGPNSAASMKRFHIEDNSRCGFQMVGMGNIATKDDDVVGTKGTKDTKGAVAFSDGRIVGNQVGLNTKDDSLSTKGMKAVEIVGNGEDVSTKDMGVPSFSMFSDSFLNEMGVQKD